MVAQHELSVMDNKGEKAKKTLGMYLVVIFSPRKQLIPYISLNEFNSSHALHFTQLLQVETSSSTINSKNYFRFEFFIKFFINNVNQKEISCH